MTFWNASSVYSADDLVEYNGDIYRCLRSGCAGTPEKDPTWWASIPCHCDRTKPSMVTIAVTAAPGQRIVTIAVLNAKAIGIVGVAVHADIPTTQANLNKLTLSATSGTLDSWFISTRPGLSGRVVTCRGSTGSGGIVVFEMVMPLLSLDSVIVASSGSVRGTTSGS